MVALSWHAQPCHSVLISLPTPTFSHAPSSSSWKKPLLGYIHLDGFAEETDKRQLHSCKYSPFFVKFLNSCIQKCIFYFYLEGLGTLAQDKLPSCSFLLCLILLHIKLHTKQDQNLTVYFIWTIYTYTGGPSLSAGLTLMDLINHRCQTHTHTVCLSVYVYTYMYVHTKR